MALNSKGDMSCNVLP